MNPWDTKLTHELSEHEMLAFVRHMDEEGIFDRERQIKSMVEEALNRWTANRGLPQWQHASFGPGRVRMSANLYEPAVGPLPHVMAPRCVEFRLLLPEWLDHEQAAFLAEMQIREIFAQNE